MHTEHQPRENVLENPAVTTERRGCGQSPRSLWGSVPSDLFRHFSVPGEQPASLALPRLPVIKEPGRCCHGHACGTSCPVRSGAQKGPGPPLPVTHHAYCPVSAAEASWWAPGKMLSDDGWLRGEGNWPEGREENIHSAGRRGRNAPVTFPLSNDEDACLTGSLRWVARAPRPPMSTEMTAP